MGNYTPTAALWKEATSSSRGCGHLTACRNPGLIRSLVSELTRTETLAEPTAMTGPVLELMAA